tara:strand:- start:3720 stop:4172 length:453 start_codon:yes stop_codon:yes gene_type:complete
MIYAKINGTEIEQYPYTLNDLRKDNPNVSFPAEITDEIKTTYGIADVNENDKPSFDPLTENIVEAPMTIVDGVVQINYIKKDFSEEEKAFNVRSQRNSNLKGSDWMALTDVTMTDEWKTYRQALRDIPEQSGFPSNVTWPEPPDNFIAEA